jgi:hypothetical protein
MTSLVLVVTGGSTIAGCLDRPVVPGEPTTKTNFTTQVAQAAVDKLDILFSIDNSASMGDKQAYLEAAIPDLINRLITPNCVDDTDPTIVKGPSTTQPDGTAGCSAYPQSQPEFPAVHDMHIGIVSSSLGPRLGDKQPSDGSGGECSAAATITINGATLNNHYDDQAHLLTRSSDPSIPISGTPTEVPLADMAANAGFLAWYPPSNHGSPPNGVTPVTTGAQLQTDFADLIAGVHEYGCGIESQLENWYRFLVQPDPYASLDLVNNKAAWIGVDTTILKQRHDFLRPDSLVAIIVLTDENDSEIDVRSIGGQGYLFMSTKFYPPHGTSQCSNPADPNCTTQGANDKSPYNSPLDWGYDLNLRHVHMKAKYGLDPQFPIGRYVNGLTQPAVPNRDGEYPPNAANYSGAVPDGKGNVTGNANCTNPLFAASLPDGSGLSGNIATATNVSQSDANTLCNLPKSTQRSKNLIFYAIIGGVPNQLLHFDPKSAANSLLTQQDWTRILGSNPDTYDYSGIDPHMVESYQPRSATPGYTLLAGETNPAPAAGGNTDPWNGREWNTNVGAHLDLNVDREYACIFKLTTPRDCSKSGTPPVYTVPANGFACDCSSTGLTPDQLSPVCDPGNPNSQIYAKAYPTIRELNLANKLGSQGIVSSICPIDVQDNAAGTDPLYGYRPAVASIVNRLKNALTNQCLPQTLVADNQGQVPCLILATLPSATDPNNPQADCSKYPGYTQPDAQILAQFVAAAEVTWKANGSVGTEPKKLPTCQVGQLPQTALSGGTCKAAGSPGWCYVTGTAAGTCSQAIIFSPGTIPTGTTINLQCIESSSALAAGTADGG